ncbi:glycosyltransferase family 25 protein [Sulfitobacter sp. F26169L]|uniref:glycosyltransferase family 25 protein n=1 Tax=Sulfitobacter sp. F26169L TaxID=2996015 RepID=UPI0022608166|nr:glycosyltransferase family 25 protein [Sulfitobacter sp. F26169L]MCX7567235.1 glycosyltransferase family 25 protein [Sulfitobacter sp. F26169L]
MDNTLHSEMVNLARATDRREHMKAELAKAGVTTTMHPAVDCREVSEDEIYAQVMLEGPWGYMHPPAAACTVSHMLLWERFLKTDKTHCLILEDDIHMSSELGDWVADLGWWPEDADIVKLERWRGKTLKLLLDQSAPEYMGRRIARMYNRHVGSAGYIINRHAAEVLLAQRPLPMTVDNLLFNINASPAACRLAIYQIQPALVVQGNEPPGWVQPPTAKYRPEGWMLLRQKLKRAYYEVAYPLATWRKLITGAAKLEPVTYVDIANGGSAPAHPSSHPTIGADPAQNDI